ncbi:Transcriptional regulator [Ruegeria pomeroyi DSS-3]|uniref:Transcriptional regulator n=3 Tax=Ruegeria pomeroyi TaxID=89184 RepID=V5UYE4_RUEPO|nr:Transcriptional regulator [Ruegeria pomeroyi DSS-3]
MWAVGPFQEEVIQAVYSLGANAYGMNVRNFLEEKQKREVHVPQVYAALSRLESLGLVNSQVDLQGSAGRRGRTRRVYEVTARGLQLIEARVRSSHGAGAKEPNRHAGEKAAAPA